MKITDIRTHVVGDQRNFLFVVVETDEGFKGVGEGGITWREAAMAGFVEALAPSLLGQDPFRTEHLWQVMFRCGFFPAGRVGAAAISALDIALWDIKAQALGVPLYQLLGGRVRDSVVCYPHIAGSTEELVAQARSRVDAGWEFLRFDLPDQSGRLDTGRLDTGRLDTGRLDTGRLDTGRLDTGRLDAGRAVQQGIEQFAAIREAVGPDVKMIIDVHTRLDATDAVALCRGLEPYQPFFVEDPVRCEGQDALRKVAAKTNTPIAMGEQYATKWEFQRPVEEELIDFARVDLCIVGGITESLKIAGWCETHYIPLAPHNPLGPVSTAACLHLDLAISNFAVQECAREPGTVLPELFPEQVRLESGRLLPPERPGLGVVLDEQAAAAYPAIVGGDCPKLTRPDNSFTNW